tara:strand:+ start:742 stop:1122 length:381 start_codon:yes stop_codon:yes gene_type:complete
MVLKTKERKIVMNAKEDNVIRNNVRKLHPLAVLLKESGFDKIKTFGGLSVPSTREFFNIKEEDSSKFTYLELFKLNENEQKELTDFISENSKAKIITIKDLRYDDNNSEATRILIDPSNMPDAVQK